MKLGALGAAIMLASISNAHSQGSPPLNAAEWASAREILEGAKANIGSGWAQGTIDPNGMPRVYCLTTAIEASFLEKRKSIVDFDYAKSALNSVVNAPSALPTFDGDPLSIPYWGRYLLYWNDAPGRTKEQVIAALDRAIAYAGQQRQAAIQANRTEADLLTFDRNSIQRLLPTLR